MTGAIKNGNNCTSAKILGITVFTYEGAVAAYKQCVKRLYEDLSIEASVALNQAEQTLNRLGYTWTEIEQFEIDAIA